jgi:ABC-type dipeptide/oligopeptide/nickel transport system ATPase component
VVERGDPALLFREARHPYTRALLAAVPGRAGAAQNPSTHPTWSFA